MSLLFKQSRSLRLFAAFRDCPACMSSESNRKANPGRTGLCQHNSESKKRAGPFKPMTVAC